MNIALDFDGTYTADPLLWELFIPFSKKRGHKIYIVTSRDPKIDTNEVLKGLEKRTDGVFYTSYTAKQHFVESTQGIKMDIWIDNDPRGIIEDLGITQEELEAFRAHERRYPHV